MNGHWTTRAPLSLLDAGLDCDGEPDPTPQDRRWLWRLEQFLAVSGTNELQHQMRRDLRQYLDETCEHHWEDYAGDETVAAHRQCSWCHDVEWHDEQAVTVGG